MRKLCHDCFTQVRVMIVRMVMTVFAVQDLAVSRKFYQDVFGWPINLEFPVLVSFKMSSNIELMLYDKDAFARNTGQMPVFATENSTSSTELYFHVDDIEEVIRKLEKAGARVLSELKPRDWGDKVAYYADPDGNVLAVASPIQG